MPAPDDCTAYYRHVEALNRYDPAQSLPLTIGGIEVGRVKRAFVPLLAGYEVFAIGPERIAFHGGGTMAERTASLDHVVRELAGQGHFRLRHEPFRVSAGWDAELLATIDRGACEFFGTGAFGVHVCGIVKREDGPHLWIGRRAMDRVTHPGKLDDMVGGGLTAGLTAREAMLKETEEETGFGPEIAAGAQAVGMVSYCHDGPGGVYRDAMFLYDLVLPEGLEPFSRDGEVERFELMPVARVAELVRDTGDFKRNCNLVIIDFMIRHGILTPDMKGYATLASSLRRKA